MNRLRCHEAKDLTVVAWLLAGVIALSALPADAAYDGYVAPLAEIPFTSSRLTGARALGMGGVALAAANDGSAMLSNPAALTRLRRIELSGGLSFEGQTIEGEALGSSHDSDISTTSISALRFVYPFPTFRGSLVLGLGFERVYGLDADFLASYDDTLVWREPSIGETLAGDWEQTEDLLSDGDIYAGTVAVAFDASESVSLGVAVSYWSGTYTRDFLYTADDANGLSADYGTYTLDVASEADVTGLQLKLGGLFYLAEGVSAGAVVTLPTALNFSGEERVSETMTGPEGWEDIDTTRFEEDIELPLIFEVGAAWSPVDLVLIGCDYSYTNWSEMENEGHIFLGDRTDRRDAYGPTHEYRVGIEVTVPEMPIRLRGGYMSRPIAYRGLTIDSDRAYWTLGAGILIDTVLAIDVAWLSGAYERSGDGYAFDEAVDETALVVEAAYRF
ncbi:outer membrane protein transport protein [bacterium]|nr:outer membrane protein transport protein [bacterium]